MSSVTDQIEAFFAEVNRRLAKAFSFPEMTSQRWLRLAMVVCTYLLVRPWLIKLGEYITGKEYENMEERDKQRMEKEKAARDQEEAINALRGKKPASNEAGTTTATEAEEEATETLTQRATRRAANAAEAQKQVEADRRAAQLENWDEDDEFLRNFARTSDRSHAAKS